MDIVERLSVCRPPNWEDEGREYVVLCDEAADTITALRARVAELEGAMNWVEPAMHALTSYEKDRGEPLSHDHQIGKIEDSRNSASFRFYVGHIRRMHAALRAKGGEHG